VALPKSFVDLTANSLQTLYQFPEHGLGQSIVASHEHWFNLWLCGKDAWNADVCKDMIECTRRNWEFIYSELESLQLRPDVDNENVWTTQPKYLVKRLKMKTIPDMQSPEEKKGKTLLLFQATIKTWDLIQPEMLR
jgi:hypothetical protein